MSPEYFHARLTYSEASDYLDGLGYRQRPGAEGARLIADTVARIAGNDDAGIRFSWDDGEDEKSSEPTDDELEALKRAKERFEKKKNEL